MPCKRESASRRDFLKTAGAGAAAIVAASGPGWGAQRSTPAEQLPHRELGKTGVRVPILGLGTAPSGFRPRREAAEFYAACLDAGITYLDTAPEFAGYGTAQLALGDVLKTRRNEAFVVTKCWEPDGEKALELLQSNLRELQTDHADLVYAHSIGSDKMDLQTIMAPRGVLPALLKAKRDGLTRFIGISGHNRPARFVEVLRHFELDVMMTAVSFVARHIYNFEDQVWPEARERGVALVAMKVYGGGTDPRGGRVPPEFIHAAFRYAQGLPGIATVVVGMYDQDELAETLRFARTYTPLSEDELRALLEQGKQLASTWGPVYGPVA